VKADLVSLHTHDLVMARLGRPGAEALRLLIARLHVGLAMPEADGDRGASLRIHKAQDPFEARPLPERRHHLLANDAQAGLEKVRWTVQRAHSCEHLASPVRIGSLRHNRAATPARLAQGPSPAPRGAMRTELVDLVTAHPHGI